MAYTTEMNVNGVMTNVTHFDHSAQEIDDAVEAAKKALPRDGSVPITRQLMITGVTEQSHIAVAGETHPFLYLNIFDASDWDHRRTLMLSSRQNSPDITYALSLGILDDGTLKDYPILHTGNKPSGSYTGNGSDVSRTIEIGGIGSALLIRGNAVSSIVTSDGAFILMEGSVSALPAVNIAFLNGVLTLATNHGGLNGNGVTYNYQVL